MEGTRPDYPWLCLVCGLSLDGIDDFPWGESGTDPTFTYCPCCSVEFGYGDATIAAIRRRREEWVEAGMPWNEERLRPPRWDGRVQLRSLPDRVR